MYGLPPDIDFSFFNGKMLFSVCISTHTLGLHFDANIPRDLGNEINVSVMSTIRCIDSKGNIHDYPEDFRKAAMDVASLIEQTIIDAKGDSNGTLTLKFSAGGILSIYDDSKQYESYTIEHHGKLTVV
jgi:hypothetical protein